MWALIYTGEKRKTFAAGPSIPAEAARAKGEWQDSVRAASSHLHAPQPPSSARKSVMPVSPSRSTFGVAGTCPSPDPSSSPAT